MVIILHWQQQKEIDENVCYVTYKSSTNKISNAMSSAM